MNKETTKLLVDQAVELDRQIEKDQERLKEMKADLIAIAQTEPEEKRTATDGGGWSLQFEGSDGQTARVTQPGAKLKEKISLKAKATQQLFDALGNLRIKLFKSVTVFEPVDDFRERAKELLKPGQATALIKAMTSASSPAVSFETKEKSTT